MMKNIYLIQKVYPILFILFIPLFSMAQPGTLDTSFSSDGKVITDGFSAEDRANAIAIQTDGKILVAGYMFSGTNANFCVLRYDGNGALDNTFGSAGKVNTPVGIGDDRAYAIMLQNDGKILLSGYAYGGSSTGIDFAVVRYRTDGNLDTSFSHDGIAMTSIGSGNANDLGFSMGLQSNGKIILGGYTDNGNNKDFALARFDTSGNLDASFGQGGRVSTSIGTSDDIAYSLVVQADDKIIMAGSVMNASNLDYALVRYKNDGSLDTSFSNDGILTTAIGTSDEEGRSLGIQSDGKILLAGYAKGSMGNFDFALCRYKSNGSLDNTFGIGGKITTWISGYNESAYAMVIQTDGKIVLAGNNYNGNYDFALVRYYMDGTLDNSFGSGGTVSAAIAAGAIDDGAYAVALQTDGKIVAAGRADKAANSDIALARFNVSTSVGVSEMNEPHIRLNIFPNPSSGDFSLQILNQDEEIKVLKLNIFNILGEKVFSNALNQEMINLNLPSGIYNCLITDKNLNKIVSAKLSIE